MPLQYSATVKHLGGAWHGKFCQVAQRKIPTVPWPQVTLLESHAGGLPEVLDQMDACAQARAARPTSGWRPSLVGHSAREVLTVTFELVLYRSFEEVAVEAL